MSRVNVAVAVTDGARNCIEEIAAECRALGFDHTATLTVVGILTGSMELGKLAILRAVPGVMAVEVECQSAARIRARARSRRLLN